MQTTETEKEEELNLLNSIHFKNITLSNFKNKMDPERKKRILATLIIPVGLAVVIVPFSLLIKWNLISALVFWFVVTPGIAIFLTIRIMGDKNHVVESLLGLVLFYGIMVFMIYDHFNTDYFQLMLFSSMVNLVLVLVIALVRRPKAGNLP